MKQQALILAVLSIFVIGCSSTDEGDTSPLPKLDPQTRLEKSTKAIESSNMTPEQKQAALDYVKHGYTSAPQMQKSVQRTSAGAPK